MAPLRIALATESYYPVGGAVAEHVHGLADQLARRGHDVVLVTGPSDQDRTRPSCRPLTETCYQVIRIGVSCAIQANGAPSRLTVGTSLGRKLRTLFDQRGIDVVHVHPAHQPVLPWVAIASAPRAVVATEHAELSPGWLTRLTRPVVRGWLRKVDELLFVSPVARDALARAFGPSEGQVIPSGIDLAWLTAPRPRPAILEAGRPHALFVGPLHPGGGLDTAVAAVRLAAQRIRDLRLVVLGDCDPLLPEVRARTRGVDIVFVNAEGADRPAFYQACDVTLMTTASSLGMTVIEAMAAGSAVIAADVPATRFMIGDESTCALVGVDDAASVAGEIIDLLHNGAYRQRRVERAHARAVMFSWDRVVERIEATYRRALARTGG